jgi:redox-sensitive bicupin YhaK (pirin superfamily)
MRRVIEGRPRDLGGFEVRRVLPAAGQHMVGPFIFFDHIGPALLARGAGVDVRPHPHIGLATVTYLFEGAFVHRDSLGSEQVIRPGDVNWMVAGRGIVHSERTPPEERAAPGGAAIHGIQTWVALPREHEEVAPAFEHHPAKTLPRISLPGARLSLIAGAAYGARAPASVYSPMFYVAAELTGGAELGLPADYQERAVYVAEGEIHVGDKRYGVGQMPVFEAGADAKIGTRAPALLLLIGGEPLDGPRHIWWNFVSSSLERIERAKLDWHEHRFGPVPGDDERIPLPA